RCLLIGHEAGVKGAGSFVARVRRDNREATRECVRIACRLRTDWILHTAVQSTTALEQKAAVPIVGKREGEADAIGFPAGAVSLIDNTIDTAARRKVVRNLFGFGNGDA